MRKTGLITVVVAMLLAGSASAELITDGGFDDVTTGLNHGDDIQTVHAGEGWYVNSASGRYFGDAGKPGPVNDDPVGWIDGVSHGKPDVGDESQEASMLQLIYDGGATTGAGTFAYDSLEASNNVVWNIWGYNGDTSTVDSKLIAETVQAPADGGSFDGLIGSGTLLNNNNATFQSESYAVDFGSGFDYILVAFSLGTDLDGDPTPGERHGAIDNVSLIPEPATLSLLGLGGLVALRRRRRA